jgi:hypothetical protein
LTRSRWTVPLIGIVMLLLLVMTSMAAEPVVEWRSALYPEDWTPEFTDAQGRFLHDFSYAGYHAGEKPLPDSVPGPRLDVTKPPYNADNTGVESATQAIQTAINDAGRAGGGTVYLPEGTYRITFSYSGISTALVIPYSNVVLQGAGVGKTFLFLDETVTRGKAMISVEPVLSGFSLTSPKGAVQALRSDVEARATVIPLADKPQFSTGEWVVVQYDLTPEWVAEHNMSDGWDSSISGPAFYRQVVAVDLEQNTITLDAPVRYAVKVRDNARVYRVSDPLSEVGLEGFSIGMREHPATKGWGDSDHGTFGTGAYDVHTGRAVSFKGVINSWVRDVATYKAEGNKYAHIHSIGFSFSQSRFLTITRVSVENPQYRGGGGNGYPFVVGSQDSLYDDLRAINGRHNFTITGMQASGNVIYRGYISNPTNGLAADFHAYLSMANLIDNLTIDQDAFEARDRSGAAGVAGFPKHGVSTTASVFWNNEGLAYRPDAQGIIRSEQYGIGYVIGTRGPAANVVAGANSRTAPADFLEGVGRGAILKPQSLYYDQLERRLLREGKVAAWESVSQSLTPPLITDVSVYEAPVKAEVSIAPIGEELPVIYAQDFEDATPGELPDGWTALANTNSPNVPFVKQATPDIAGSSGKQVLAVTRTANSGNVTGSAIYTFTPATERLRVSFKMLCTTERRSLRVILGGSAQTPEDVHAVVANAGIFIAMNGGQIRLLLDAAKNTWADAGLYSPGRWHTITLEIDIPGQVLDVYLDDSNTPTNAMPVPFYASYNDINTIGFAYQSLSNHNNTAPAYIDDLVIVGR